MIAEPLDRLSEALAGRLHDPDARVKVPVQWTIPIGGISVDVPIGIVPLGWRWVVSATNSRLTVNQTCVIALIADDRQVWTSGLMTQEGLNNSFIDIIGMDFTAGQVLMLRPITNSGGPTGVALLGESYVQFDAYHA